MNPSGSIVLHKRDQEVGNDGDRAISERGPPREGREWADHDLRRLVDDRAQRLFRPRRTFKRRPSHPARQHHRRPGPSCGELRQRVREVHRPGSPQSRGGLNDASKDENAVVFRKKRRDEFDAVRARVRITSDARMLLRPYPPRLTSPIKSRSSVSCATLGSSRTGVRGEENRTPWPPIDRIRSWQSSRVVDYSTIAHATPDGRRERRERSANGSDRAPRHQRFPKPLICSTF